MSDVTHILSRIESGDPHAAEQLLPLVYAELRKLAAAKLAQEKPGQTLDATALVHEAYLRLAGSASRAKPNSHPESADDNGPGQAGDNYYNSRGHFFGAAAEAMRRILIEGARRKTRLRHGGDMQRHSLDAIAPGVPQTPEELLSLDEALGRLEVANQQAAELVKLRYFVGLTNEEAAAALAVSPRKANQIWAYARAWLLESLGREPA